MLAKSTTSCSVCPSVFADSSTSCKDATARRRPVVVRWCRTAYVQNGRGLKTTSIWPCTQPLLLSRTPQMVDLTRWVLPSLCPCRALIQTLLSTALVRRQCNRQLRQYRRLRVERLGHHFGLAAILDNQGAIGEDAIHSVNDLVEAAGSALFLCEARDTEVMAPSVLNDGHDLNREMDFLDVEDLTITICQRILSHTYVARQERGTITHSSSCLLARTKYFVPCQPRRPGSPTCATPAVGS